jgi:flavin-dependent dehydrogenase
MHSTTDICIIGGGPAGSTLAARLAQLGHDVCLVERVRFPRRHLGESLSPGVLPLLATVGMSAAVASAGFTPVRSVSVNWDQGRQQREDPTGQGLLVDRGHFDQLLLDHARAIGVRVFQPATVAAKTLLEDGWNLRIEKDGSVLELRAAFLADATGRAALLRSHRRETGCRTVALYAYWQGHNLPTQPRIEAGAAEWYWGVPLPQGVYNTLVFVDAARFHAARASLLQAGFHALIKRSSLLAGCTDARFLGRVLAADATPYLDEECLTSHSIKVGDAALALDPLSSSGVQKAIQTALSGAVVVNTLLRKPERGEAALRFYRDTLRKASERHRQWAAVHYGSVAEHRAGKFWKDRAAFFSSFASPLASTESTGHRLSNEMPLALSRKVAFVNLPCLDGAFVQVKAVVQHPSLEGPVAYLRDWELAPLLHQVRAGMTLQQVALTWMPAIPLDDGRAIARWLVGHGILVPWTAAPSSGPAPGRMAA